MRVAIFTETYLPDANGVATHIKTLKDGLEALGHSVLIVKADSKVHHSQIHDGVLSVPAITSKKLYNYSLASPMSVNRFRLIKQWKPDIIHIQNEFGIGYSGVIIGRMMKIPIVYTLHTMYDDYIYYIAKKPFIPAVTNVSHKYCKFLAKKSDALTGASVKIEDYFKKCGVKKPVNIIPNAVELDIFQQKSSNVPQIKQRFGIGENTVVFCFCGRLGKEKNIDTLLKFWADKVKPEDDMKLLIFGGGPDLELLTDMAKQLGIDDKVVFTGRVEHKELPPYYAACNAYITCSLSENYSISMLEAMASGLPIIHLFDEKNESQTTEGLNGYVFHDENEMYAILKRFEGMTAEEKTAMAENVAESVKSSGAIDLAKYLVDVYGDILRKRKNVAERGEKKSKSC